MSAVVEADPRVCDAAPTLDIGGFTVVRSDTALAFLVAPAVPAGLAALALAVAVLRDGGVAGALGVFCFGFAALAFGGYLSALVLGVPAYLLVRAATRVIPPGAATLVGGIVAALPWVILAIAARSEALFMSATVIFGLGCVGGFAFSLVRDGLPWRDIEMGR